MSGQVDPQGMHLLSGGEDSQVQKDEMQRTRIDTIFRIGDPINLLT